MSVKDSSLISTNSTYDHMHASEDVKEAAITTSSQLHGPDSHACMDPASASRQAPRVTEKDYDYLSFIDLIFSIIS